MYTYDLYPTIPLKVAYLHLPVRYLVPPFP